MEDLALIAGQKPVDQGAPVDRQFKLREGMMIGAKVTLRKDRMYEFLDRLVTIALPRVRDFRGLKPTSFDGRGNYAMGLKEHIVFPEINYDQIDQIWGMDIVVSTTARTDDEARELLREFQFPFRAANGSGKEQTMAKKSAVNRNNGSKLVTAAAKRAALKATANNESRRSRSASKPASSWPSCRAARPRPDPQPLRSHRPSACLLPKAEDEPYRASRHLQFSIVRPGSPGDLAAIADARLRPIAGQCRKLELRTEALLDRASSGPSRAFSAPCA